MNVRLLIVFVVSAVAAYVAASVTASVLLVWACVVAEDGPDV